MAHSVASQRLRICIYVHLKLPATPECMIKSQLYSDFAYLRNIWEYMYMCIDGMPSIDCNTLQHTATHNQTAQSMGIYIHVYTWNVLHALAHMFHAGCWGHFMYKHIRSSRTFYVYTCIYIPIYIYSHWLCSLVKFGHNRVLILWCMYHIMSLGIRNHIEQ